MKDKKTIIIISAIVTVLAVASILFAALRGRSEDNPNCISRQEWIGMLGEHTGANDYSSETPYFNDVDESNEYYSFIQSAVEWDYLMAGGKFNGERNATGEFVAITAIKSIGVPKIELYLGTDKQLEEKDYLNLATDLSLIETKQLKNGLSDEQAEEVLEKLDELYYGEFWPRDVEEVEYQEHVKKILKGAIISFDRDSNELITTEALQNNDIISFRYGGIVVNRKVEAVHGEGVYGLGFPEMEEVYTKLVQSGVAELTFQDIVNYYGDENLTVAEGDENKQPAAVNVSFSKDESFQSKGFKIEAEESDNKLDIFITDNDTGIRKKLLKTPEIPAYSNFSASIDVKKTFVGSQINYSIPLLEIRDSQKDFSILPRVNYADVAVDIETDNQIGVAADEEISDRIILFETPVPIGTGEVGVDIQVYLVTTLSGEIYLKAEIPFQEAFHYEMGKGVRRTSHKMSIKEPEVLASAEMKNKIELAPILVVGAAFPVIDAEIGAGITDKAEVHMRDNGQVCTDAAIEYPVVDISVGELDVLYYGRKSLIAKLGWSASWENIFKDKGFYKTYSIHFERLSSGEKQFVEKCTYGQALADDVSDSAILNGDFSEFAGTYKATEWTNDGYGGGQRLDDLMLDNGGIITGGGAFYSPEPYPRQKPISVEIDEDGSYKCIVNEETDMVGNIFYIYPAGIVEERFKDDEQLVNSVYIRYVQIDGGISEMVYYKTASTKSTAGLNTYKTKDSSMPEFAIDYPDNWSIKDEEAQSNGEWSLIQSERGIKINFYSSDVGFGNQFYGGDKVLKSVHITKASDADFIPADYNGKSYSSLGSYVVAKLKVYAQDDGMTEGGAAEYDGPTYYAVVPESYLGDDEFFGMGYLSMCSSEYVKPMVIIAESPDGRFSAAEEKEIIQILSSFRTTTTTS